MKYKIYCMGKKNWWLDFVDSRGQFHHWGPYKSPAIAFQHVGGSAGLNWFEFEVVVKEI